MGRRLFAFDWGGVLFGGAPGTYCAMDARQGLAGAMGAKDMGAFLSMFAEGSAFWEARGAAFDAVILKHLHISGALADVARFKRLYLACHGKVPWNEGMVRLFADTAKRYPVALLSNCCELDEELMAAHLPLPHAMYTFYSFALGARKPDTAMWRAVALASGRRPPDITFFDDNMENVAAARAFGFDAHRVAGADAPVVADIIRQRMAPLC